MPTQISPTMIFKIQKPLFPPHTKTGRVWLVYARGKKYMAMITEDQIPSVIKDYFVEEPQALKVYSHGRVIDETLDSKKIAGRVRYEHIEFSDTQDFDW